MSDEATKQHELLQQLKELALELQRTPTSNEFIGKVHSVEFRKYFGDYQTFITAAGLDPVRKSKKINNTIFHKNVENFLEKNPPKELLHVPTLTPYARLAVISDIHWPFDNQRLIEKFWRYCEKHQPDNVILNGDAWDMYSHSRFPRSHNIFTPREEQDLSRKKNVEFWAEVNKACPKAAKYQMLGNHDVRPLKKILDVYPAGEDWMQHMFQELFTFEGVKTIFDPREELMLSGDIMVHHGYRTKLGDHMAYALYNSIVGHTHHAGVVYRQIRGQTLWELNSGLAGDPLAKGLTYTPQKITTQTKSFGAVDEDGPRVILD